MPTTTLNELLERNEQHVASLPEDYFSTVLTEQRPAAVSICCADSRVPQSGMWNVDEPGWLFTPSTIGNQVWDTHEGERTVDGSIIYPIQHAETSIVVIVGHTGCGAITAALSSVQSGDVSLTPGVKKWIDLLTPVVRDGLADDRIDPDGEIPLIDQLVEYNVDRQVEFLLESPVIEPENAIFGFVYDFIGTYGDDPGRAYLTNVDGETNRSDIESYVDDHNLHSVKRLLWENTT